MNQGKSGARLGGIFTIDCYGENGQLKWSEKSHNIVTNVGLDHILDVTLNAATQVSTWYVGIKNAGSVAAGDTMASHAGWTENQNYSEATRVAYVEAASSGQSVTNSASKASFSINTNTQTIAGAFLVSDSTKGGTSGTLLCVADFASSKAADNGDTLEVTYTISAADDGA